MKPQDTTLILEQAIFDALDSVGLSAYDLEEFTIVFEHTRRQFNEKQNQDPKCIFKLARTAALFVQKAR